MPTTGFKVLQGNLKTYTKPAESGNTMTSYFCSDCGSTMYRKTSHTNEAVALMIGSIEGLHKIEQSKPQVELFIRNRPSWMAEIPGAHQVEGTCDLSEIVNRG